MTIDLWLQSATKSLSEANIGSSCLDAELIAGHVLNRPREWVVAHPEYEIEPHLLAQMDELLTKRAQRHPLAHLTGSREFYGLDFEITPSVLTPRPETEPMIDWAVKYAPKSGHLIDIGTGSGAIAIAIAKSRPDLVITGTDVTAESLEVARRNDERHRAQINFIQSNLWQNVPGRYQTVVTNLPYLPDDSELMPEVRREPGVALFGGPDGLDLYHKLLAEVADYLDPGGYLFCEADPWQHEQLEAEAAKVGLKKIEEDYFILGFQLAGQ